MKIVGLFDHGGVQRRQNRVAADRRIAGPYRVDLLMEHGIDLIPVPPAKHPWHCKARDVIEHRTGTRVDLAVRSAPRILGAEGALALLEDKAVLPGKLRRLGIPPYHRVPLTTVSCWWAEELRHGSPERVRAIRTALRGIDDVICFSRNQRSIFAAAGMPEDRIHPVRFGVDPDYYCPGEGTRDFDVVAMGIDRGRDYETLLDAARRLPDTRFDIFTQPGRVLDPPPNVTIHGPVSMEQHRDNLRSARLVVVPTHALAYPTGQSVLLEAMACGASVAATATAAMEEYLQDGRSNLALPAGDPVGVAKVIERALGDEAQRRRIGRAARHRVLDSFTFQQLWAAVADILREAAVRPRF